MFHSIISDLLIIFLKIVFKLLIIQMKVNFYYKYSLCNFYNIVYIIIIGPNHYLI